MRFLPSSVESVHAPTADATRGTVAASGAGGGSPAAGDGSPETDDVAPEADELAPAVARVRPDAGDAPPLSPVASLNLPIPGAVKRIANDFHPSLTAFDNVRENHTFVVKRIDSKAWRADPHRVRERLRRVVERTPPFEVRVWGVDFFADPPSGTAPVVYLAVESPGLHQLHGRLCREFDPVEGIEGEAYTPHITLARGGRVEDAERLAHEPVDPVTWTASELMVWDRRYREAADWFKLR